MGIDNDAILIYGWTFEYAEFVQKVKKVMGEETFNELVGEYDIVDVFRGFMSELEELNVGSASPYYDSAMDERTYYISFEFKNTNEIYDLMQYHKAYGFDEYKILKIMEIENPPEVRALPHIW